MYINIGYFIIVLGYERKKKYCTNISLKLSCCILIDMHKHDWNLQTLLLKTLKNVLNTLVSNRLIGYLSSQRLNNGLTEDFGSNSHHIYLVYKWNPFDKLKNLYADDIPLSYKSKYLYNICEHILRLTIRVMI